ncbi:alpha/beta hydrolase [Pedobacter alluvionis]|nr:alpha/beta hydrolase [Pedobacter alluvionis]
MDEGIQEPKSVHFRSGNLTLAGHLYIPFDFKEGEKRPAVIVLSPGGGIKEQTSGRYASELSKKGFIALAFDHRSYGESEGYPRFDEDPFTKVEDTKNAVSYLTTRTEVDSERIGVMGICGGGGVAPTAAATDRRIKAVATVSGMTDQRGAMAEQFGDHKTLISVLDACSHTRSEIALGKEPIYYPLIPPADAPNVMDLLKQAPDYYFNTSRGAHPNWENKILPSSMEKLATFSALDTIKLISPNPILLIAGSKAGSRKQNEIAYETAEEPKELFIIDNATHLDLYDIDCFVSSALEKLTEFFGKNLK